MYGTIYAILSVPRHAQLRPCVPMHGWLRPYVFTHDWLHAFVSRHDWCAYAWLMCYRHGTSLAQLVRHPQVTRSFSHSFPLSRMIFIYGWGGKIPDNAKSNMTLQKSCAQDNRTY